MVTTQTPQVHSPKETKAKPQKAAPKKEASKATTPTKTTRKAWQAWMRDACFLQETLQKYLQERTALFPSLRAQKYIGQVRRYSVVLALCLRHGAVVEFLFFRFAHVF